MRVQLFAKGTGHILTALVGVEGDGVALGVHTGRVEAAVLQRGEVAGQEVVTGSAIAEGAVLTEAAQRVVQRTHGQVGRAAQREVRLLADGGALGAGVLAGAGVSQHRNQNAGLAL